MNIFVASTSVHKVLAVEEAARLVFPGQELVVEGRKASSDINEQPVGNEETLLGAKNRLRNLQRIIGDARYDFLVALEGGIFSLQEADGETWHDCGWVIAQDTRGNLAKAHCAGIQISAEDVEAARKKGFATTTVGSIVAARTNTDGTNPQEFLTKGKLNRTEILRQAVVGALAQLMD